ncbi:MAG: Gfo/Idh/MocA family oxidoreductase [Bacteroidota bacterium]
MRYQPIAKDNPLSICFLGCGKITHRHAKSARNCKTPISLSFASRDEKKANIYKNKYKGQVAFGSYEAAMESEVDVVMVNTPPNTHYQLTRYALENGKHVIVEKPPFYTTTELEELGKLADTNALQLIIAENYYYKPLRLAILRELKKGVIGTPLFININAQKKQQSADWRNDPSVVKYGALFEGGIHWINFINNIGLELTKVHGFIPKQDGPLERSIQAAAHTKEGVVVNLFYSWETDALLKGLRISKIFGKEGSITFETNGLFMLIRGKKTYLRFPNITNITGQQLMFNDFMNALQTGKSPAFHWKMAKRDLKIIEAIYESTASYKDKNKTDV